jgi:hypothetical protein
MSANKSLPEWLDGRSATAAVISAIVLFAVSYAADQILDFLKIPAALTVANNLAIAAVGAAVVLIFLRLRYQHEVVARAKERALIVAEMNHHIRNAMTPLVLGVSSDDVSERLRTLDQATDRMDHVLTELLPTAGSATNPRYL